MPLPALQPGAILGRFRIERQLGRGGMGVVYLGRDQTLDRLVAVKGLPPTLKHQPDMLARFRQEAKTLAALNHPHIATLYDEIEHDGQGYLVMEYIQGVPLADRLKPHPLPWKQALRVAGQTAEALAAAHDAGVIHRDFKPANIMISDTGQATVLDFGVAMVRGSDPTKDTARLTDPGLTVGTPAYMSPEQLRGDPLDPRCDIWAFGCVLYEMLTGVHPFSAPTAADTLTRALALEPDWALLPSDLPIPIQVLVRRCLEKEPERRLQHAGDVALEIRETLESRRSLTAVGTERTASARPRPWRRMLLAGGIGLTIGYGGAVWMGKNLSTPLDPATAQTATMAIRLPGARHIASSRTMPLGIGQPVVAVAPNGSCLVYAAEQDDQTQLYVRPIGEWTAHPIPGSQGGFAPFFSPDGRSVGFFTAEELKTVSLRGGHPISLCEVRNPRGGDWGGDGYIYLGDMEGWRFSRIRATGGQREDLTTADPNWDDGFVSCNYPQLLPGGESVVLSARDGIAVFSLKTGMSRRLIEGGVYPRYIPGGYLLYAQAGALRAVRFDPETRQTAGPVIPVLAGLATDSRHGLAQYAVSQQGLLAYVPGRDAARSIPTWVHRNGETEPLALPPDIYGHPRLSPDDRLLALNLGSKQRRDIAIFDPDTGRRLPLLAEPGAGFPTWTPNGQHLLYTSGAPPPEGNGISRIAVNGSGASERLLTRRYAVFPQSLSPDGTVLAFTEYRPDTKPDIWLLPLDGSGPARLLIHTPDSEWLPQFSPNGRYLAYISDRDGKYQVYVQPYPAMDQIWQVSAGFGEEPIWSAQGDQLFYRNGDAWMAVPVTTEPGFTAGIPALLFEGPYLNAPGHSYDVSRDAQRFLVLKPEHDDAHVTEIHVMLQWEAILESTTFARPD